MTTIIIVAIIAAVVYYIYYLSHGNHKEEEDKWFTEQPTHQAAVIESPKIVIGGGSDAPVQQLQYFCIKDKGYHVSVWQKDQSQFDIVEFNIAGMSHRENIDDYLGEFQGTLEAEPTNTYDHNAIKVLAPDGHHVGYVPADTTKEIRDNAQLPCPCYCYIGENDGVYFSDCYIPRK